jgi:AcrR family transcriptional regulator
MSLLYHEPFDSKRSRQSLIHEALIYSGDDEFAAALAPFLREAVTAGDPAVAVTTAARIRVLREALGADAAAVAFFDATEWYHRPGAALVTWRAALDEAAASGAHLVRAVGEVPFGADSVASWTRYESLFNRAFANRNAWVVCPYDSRNLSDEILAAARGTHPVVSTHAGRAPSPEHFAQHELGAALSPGVDRQGAEHGASTTLSPASDPVEVRRNVVWTARAAGISGDAVEDLLLAVGEIARAGFAAGWATATVRTGRAGGEWFCEIAGARRPADALPLDENGLGIVIGRLICDRVEISDNADNSLVRLVFGTPHPDARQRIVAAGAELFARDGVQATGVNAVIARAGVAKGTFYAHFPSKNDLVLAWLQSSSVRWFDGLRSELEARAQSPAERLTLFFDILGEWLTADDFRGGCQVLNRAAESRQLEHPARAALADLQREIELYLRSAAADAGLVDPDALAAQLFLLVPGTIVTATARGSAEPAAVARIAAARLVAAAARDSRSADRST